MLRHGISRILLPTARVVQGRVRDIFTTITIMMFAMAVLFPRARVLGLAHDGLLLAYASFKGDLQGFIFHDIKDPGRPFVGLGIKVAELVTGGTVTGYNLFMLGCYTASALIVYAIMRRIVPTQPFWAIAAAFVKITWPANFEVFDNSGLIIYFTEFLFWLSLLLLIVGVQSQSTIALLLSVVGIIVVSGSYQTFWWLVVLLPLTLVATNVLPLRHRFTTTAAILWLIVLAIAAAWSTLRTFEMPIDAFPEALPTPIVLLQRIGNGVFAVTVQLLYEPFIWAWRYGRPNALRDLAVALMVLLLLWSALRTPRPTVALRPTAWIILAGGLLVVVGALAFPALRSEIVYGQRFTATAVSGTILIFGALLLFAAISFGRIAIIAGALAIGVLIYGSAVALDFAGARLVAASYPDRRFWEDMIAEVPRLDEGTVLVFDEPRPPNIALFDHFSTRMVRAFSDTQLTFFVTAKPAERRGDYWRIVASIDLDRKQPGFTRGRTVLPAPDVGAPVIEARYFGREEPPLATPREFLVPADRVVVLRWDPKSLRLWVDPAKSAMQRVHPDVPSTFGQRLYPAREIAQDRIRPPPQ